MIDAALGDDEYEGLDTSFNTEEMDASIPPSSVKPLKDDLDELVKDELRKQTKSLAEEKRKQRLALKREMQDETIKRSIQTKLDKRAAYDRRNQLRASAVSQRIQAYSIASSLGFAGYVAASVVDQFVIRPKEKADIAAEDQYNADYAAYEQFQKADQLERRRQREDEISEMKVNKASIRNNIFNGRPTSFQEKPPEPTKQQPDPRYESASSGKVTPDQPTIEVPPTQQPTGTNTGFTGAFTQEYKDKLLAELNDPNIHPKHRAFNEKLLEDNAKRKTPTPTPTSTGFKGKFSEEYRNKILDELNDPNISSQHRAFNEKLLEDNAKPTPSPTLEAPSRNKAAETQQTVDRASKAAEAFKPVAPVAATSFIEKYGAAGLAVASGITIAQGLNQQIESAGTAVGDLGKSVFAGSTTEGLRATAKSIKSVIDPLGINPVVQVAVTGFDTLLSLTESIKSYSEKDKEFSPLTLQTSIQGDIARLMQSIDIAQKNDPLKAQVTEMTARLDLAWNEFKSEVFQKSAPAMLTALGILTGLMEQQNKSKYGPLDTLILGFLGQIADNTKPEPVLQTDLLKDLTAFMDPKNLKDLPGKAFNNKMPNRVP